VLPENADQERQASWLELFFDLVLVAAVAALADQLHRHHSLSGLAIFAGLFVPVWWVWWGFTWYSSAFNSDDTVNRLGLLAGMAGVGAISVGVPGAADGHSDTFVVACAALFALLAALFARAWLLVPTARPLSERLAVGDALGAAVWLSSLAVGEHLRPLAWVAAMVILMGTPVLAAASLPVLSYDPRQIAERYGLFTLIVLGESVVATISSLDARWCTAAILVALLGLVLAAAIWWLYFDRWRSMPVGGLRSGYVWAQGHLLVFAGIAATAVGLELAVEAASDGRTLELADRLPLGGGLASYFTAMALIRGATRRADWVVGLRLATAGALLAAALIGHMAPTVLVAVTAALVAGEVAFELHRAPAEPARPRPRLPHELGRPRGSAPGP
jgi:low temperature requirement protein LtrA